MMCQLRTHEPPHPRVLISAQMSGFGGEAENLVLDQSTTGLDLTPQRSAKTAIMLAIDMALDWLK